MNQMNNALYVKPYDAGAASEGTPRTPTHGIPSPLHSPGPAPSVDGAAAMPIIDVEAKKQLRATSKLDAIFFFLKESEMAEEAIYKAEKIL
jgi:hypothetical protein